MATHPDRVAGNPYRKQLFLLDVVVNGTSIDIDDSRRTGNPDHFDVFPAARAPNFVAAREGRLKFCHGLFYSQLGV